MSPESPDLERCKQCRMFFSALRISFFRYPALRDTYLQTFEFDTQRRRRFDLIEESKLVPNHYKLEWIKEVLLEASERVLRSDSSETGQGKVSIADDRFAQEHFHCHIARYSPSMPHSDSARDRPSSHLPRARSNPLRFVKSAR